jgi:putative mycofactocin binding protein MftB
MNTMKNLRYILSSGTQVREEDFGLLFYTMRGPRLYFLSSGSLLAPSFFEGKRSLGQWMQMNRKEPAPENRIEKIKKVLGQLAEKGVIIEC